MTNERIAAAVEKAQEKFWAIIASRFPEIRSGDFSPDAQMKFDGACEEAVRIWIDSNT
ncbi:hypothetical protein L539_3487 [Bordetella hinzii 5132]|uniref:hypothetical protein n=1 Tax=Pseudomonas sp. TaxID=306 RepID=UPI00045B0510|nr:hypothetical protein L539_3487 [Bordetella hinzii 5132]